MSCSKNALLLRGETVIRAIGKTQTCSALWPRSAMQVPLHGELLSVKLANDFLVCAAVKADSTGFCHGVITRACAEVLMMHG